MNNMHVDENAIDVLVNILVDGETKILNDRIGNNTVDLTNYLKHDGGSGTKVTGKALLLNKISNLTVIDFDINKEYDVEQKQVVRNKIMSKLSDEDVIVRTGSGGLHVYCNTEFFYTTTNRMIKCYSCEDYDVDLMTSVDEKSRSLIVAAGSKVRRNAREAITTYEFLQGSYESVITRNVNDVLNDLDIKIKVKQSPDVERLIAKNDKSVVISDELAEALIYGLENIEIHNDGGSMPIKKEVTLFTLFQAINALPTKYINQAYETVYECCNLTDKAATNFENARTRYQHLSTSPFVLAKILKIYNPDYYNTEVKHLLGTDIVIHEINLKDSFTLTDVVEKANKRKYKMFTEVVEDLSKVIRFIEVGIMYIQKTYDIYTKSYTISFVTEANMSKMLKMIKLWKDNGNMLTAYDAMISQLYLLTVKGIRFNSKEEQVFSLFQGFKYNVLDTVDESVIQMYLDLIKDVIANGEENVYNYILNWIANIVQNPGSKNETALVLKGLQGIGKNRFTDVISEMLAGYSAKNVTEISELTGNFNSVVENKMLIVLNELKNCGDDRLANYNSLKSIITDDSIRINEKNQPRRTAENVANFIFVTNNAFPVKIEAGDRRYVVCACNGKHKGDFDYFTKLCNSYDKNFYDNLLTFFMKRDLSSFEIRRIPETEAKQDLIDASRTPFDQWICDHYDQLCSGIQCSETLISKPSDMKDRNFQLQIKDKCERKQKRVNGVRTWYYVLKDDCKSLYKQTTVEYC